MSWRWVPPSTGGQTEYITFRHPSDRGGKNLILEKGVLKQCFQIRISELFDQKKFVLSVYLMRTCETVVREIRTRLDGQIPL